MGSPEIDHKRRRFLTVAATVVGGAGAVAASVPFVSMMMPSARTRLVGGPAKVDIGGIGENNLQVAQWRGNPIWIIHRGKRVIADLAAREDELKDPESALDIKEGNLPEYAHNSMRSRKPEYLVLIGLCTHLGCSPRYVGPDERHERLPPDAAGGIVCACHGSSFDMAGRVYAGSPAPTNLIVPKHYFIDEATLVIGEDGAEGSA